LLVAAIDVGFAERAESCGIAWKDARGTETRRWLEPPEPATFVDMDRGVVVRGRLRGRHIDLDEPVAEPDGEVEVTVRPVTAAHPTVADMLAVVATFPSGTRTKEDIDRQIAEDRAGWDRA